MNLGVGDDWARSVRKAMSGLPTQKGADRPGVSMHQNAVDLFKVRRTALLLL
jgi:hypothetical protein